MTEIERIKKQYAEELKRKDKMIDELKEQNAAIMKSALKQSEKITELTDKLNSLKSSKSK